MKMATLAIALFIAGCGDNQHIKDLSNIDLELEVSRFEQDLFTCRSVKDILALRENNADFYAVYTNNLVAANVHRPGANDTDIAVELYKYISHRDMDSLFQITQEEFSDFGPYQEELEEAAKYIALYFPEEKIEKVTTFISTFQYGSIFNQKDKEFGVGLDMYLGSDFEVYQLLNPQNFPAYRTKKFEPYRIVPNCVKAFVDYKTPPHIGKNFIEQAIYEGKKLYLMDLLLPTHHDSLKMGYLTGQIEWIEDQEENMWKYLVEENVLFSSDKNDFQRHYFNEGPFTTPFGTESSPKAGVWIGWQIVRKYMNKNPKVTIAELLENRNHQAIFTQSGYRP